MDSTGTASGVGPARAVARIAVAGGAPPQAKARLRPTAKGFADERQDANEHRPADDVEHRQGERCTHDDGPPPAQKCPDHDDRDRRRQPDPEWHVVRRNGRRLPAGDQFEISRPLGGVRDEREQCKDAGRRRDDDERPPLTPDDEPEQAHSRRDLRQQDERPRRWMAKANDDGCREEDLDVARIDLGRNGHEEQDGKRERPREIDESHEQQASPDSDEDLEREPAAPEDDELEGRRIVVAVVLGKLGVRVEIGGICGPVVMHVDRLSQPAERIEPPHRDGREHTDHQEGIAGEAQPIHVTHAPARPRASEVHDPCFGTLRRTRPRG